MNQAQITVAPQAQATAPRTVRPASPALAFRMLQGFRPMAGAALYAHTAAVLQLTGMDKGKRVPYATLVAVLGETAVKHHQKTTGFFGADEKGVFLSELGKINPHWLAANVNAELKAACIEVLTTGKTNDKVIKNAAGIKAI